MEAARDAQRTRDHTATSRLGRRGFPEVGTMLALALLCLRCGGGSLREVRGAGFILSADEATIATAWEAASWQPTTGGAAESCEYWRQRHLDVQQLRKRSWSPEEFESLEQWSVAKRAEVCERAASDKRLEAEENGTHAREQGEEAAKEAPETGMLIDRAGSGDRPRWEEDLASAAREADVQREEWQGDDHDLDLFESCASILEGTKEPWGSADVDFLAQCVKLGKEILGRTPDDSRLHGIVQRLSVLLPRVDRAKALAYQLLIQQQKADATPRAQAAQQAEWDRRRELEDQARRDAQQRDDEVRKQLEGRAEALRRCLHAHGCPTAYESCQSDCLQRESGCCQNGSGPGTPGCADARAVCEAKCLVQNNKCNEQCDR